MMTRGAVGLTKKSQGFPYAHLFPSIPHHENIYNSPGTVLKYRLPLTAQPVYHLLGQAAYCLLWLGALAVFLVVIVNAIVDDKGKWLWVIAASLVGYVAASATTRFLSQLRETIRIGPSHLEISRLPLFPGQRCVLSYSQSGRMFLASAKLAIVCDEFVEYREGTNNRSESRRVFDKSLFKLENVNIQRQEPVQYEIEFTVPRGIMHSFQSNCNAIRWSFELIGHTKSGSKFQRVYPVVVIPQPPHEIDRG